MTTRTYGSISLPPPLPPQKNQTNKQTKEGSIPWFFINKTQWSLVNKEIKICRDPHNSFDIVELFWISEFVSATIYRRVYSLQILQLKFYRNKLKIKLKYKIKRNTKLFFLHLFVNRSNQDVPVRIAYCQPFP